jgi:hypothetical protein
VKVQLCSESNGSTIFYWILISAYKVGELQYETMNTVRLTLHQDSNGQWISGPGHLVTSGHVWIPKRGIWINGTSVLQAVFSDIHLVFKIQVNLQFEQYQPSIVPSILIVMKYYVFLSFTFSLFLSCGCVYPN